MDAKHHHDDQTGEPHPVSGEKQQRFFPARGGEPIIAIGNVGPLWILARQCADKKTYEARHPDQKSQNKSQISVPGHPSISAMIGPEMSANGLGKIACRVDDKHRAKDGKTNQRNQRAGIGVFAHVSLTHNLAQLPSRLAVTDGYGDFSLVHSSKDRLTAGTVRQRLQSIGDRVLALLGDLPSRRQLVDQFGHDLRDSGTRVSSRNPEL